MDLIFLFGTMAVRTRNSIEEFFLVVIAIVLLLGFLSVVHEIRRWGRRLDTRLRDRDLPSCSDDELKTECKRRGWIQEEDDHNQNSLRGD